MFFSTIIAVTFMVINAQSQGLPNVTMNPAVGVANTVVTLLETTPGPPKVISTIPASIPVGPASSPVIAVLPTTNIPMTSTQMLSTERTTTVLQYTDEMHEVEEHNRLMEKYRELFKIPTATEAPHLKTNDNELSYVSTISSGNIISNFAALVVLPMFLVTLFC